MKLSNKNIICFAGEDWWYHNPHSNLHIMKEFAKDNRVLFVNSIGVRMPDLKKDPYAWKRIFGKLKSLARYLKKAEPNIWVLTPLALPLAKGKEAKIRAFNRRILGAQMRWAMGVLRMKNPVLWVSLPAMKDVAMDLKKDASAMAYYCVDNIAHFEGANPDEIQSLEKELMQAADAAFFVSHDLFQQKKALNPNTHFLSHGVDVEHFAAAASGGTVPEDIRSFKRPIAGYVGAIKDLDFDLVAYLAKNNPSVTFLFIGDLYSETERLMREHSNVHFIGKRPYEALPNYMRAFDAACLYYKTGDPFNDFRNPKKLLEYLATGKPIVSVDIREMKYFKDVVRIAGSYEEFNARLRQALEDKDPHGVARRMELSRNHTWESVADRAGAEIAKCLKK